MKPTSNSTRSVRIYQILSAIVEHIDNAIEDTKPYKNYTELSLNRVAQNSVAMEIIQIAELSKKVDSDFSKAHPDIPWNELRGLRNRLVHEYDQIEWDIVFRTVQDDLPVFRKALQGVIYTNQESRPSHKDGNVFKQADKAFGD